MPRANVYAGSEEATNKLSREPPLRAIGTTDIGTRRCSPAEQTMTEPELTAEELREQAERLWPPVILTVEESKNMVDACNSLIADLTRR